MDFGICGFLMSFLDICVLIWRLLDFGFEVLAWYAGVVMIDCSLFLVSGRVCG